VAKLEAAAFQTGFPRLAVVGVVVDDQYIYWRDTTAIGRIPIP
jgi:hypothetical protein